MLDYLMRGRDYVQLAWRSMRCPDRLLAVALLLIVGSSGCCTTPQTPMFPTCPTPTTEMVAELESGALDDAPSVEEYLGRVENLCDALKEYD